MTDPIVKTCSCGETYTAAEFAGLKLATYKKGDEQTEWRICGNERCRELIFCSWPKMSSEMLRETKYYRQRDLRWSFVY